MAIKIKIKLIAALAAIALANAPAKAQNVYPGGPVVPLGYCILSAAQLAASIGLSACVSANFTGTGSGANLTASAVTGAIRPGQTVTGTGVPTGTTILSQTSGAGGCAPVGAPGCAAFGAGVYVTSQPTTSSAAALISGGIPIATSTTPAANAALLEADTANIRFRDDGGIPTASVGIFLIGTSANSVQNQLFYTGTLSALQFIASGVSPILHVAFYQFYRQ